MVSSSAVNNEQVLRSCLLKSPDLDAAVEVILQSGFASAAAAFNSAMQRAKADIIVFVHQDVYLPEGWVDRVRKAIEVIGAFDPNWGVLGIWGVGNDGAFAGHLHWTGVEGTAGKRFDGGIEVETLDEVLLIVRRSSGLLFDELLPGYHMYGADICSEAGRRGIKCYAISAFCIHNTDNYKMLPLQFWRAYLFMRSKWKSQLPIRTTCTEITRWCWPMFRWNIVRAINLALRREKPKKRVPDPSLLYDDFVSRRIVAP